MKILQGFSASGLEPYALKIRRATEAMEKSSLISRIWQKDYTVWKKRNEEISNRLGWLEAPVRARKFLTAINSFVQDVRKDGFTHALLLGMGGSSLAPEVLSRVFGTSQGYLKLDVLDSTDPATVLSMARALPFEETLFIVSSKSGTTLETSSFLNFFYTLACDRIGKEHAGAHFAAITDPGTPLENTARALRFRRVFSGDPDIGGRFSALSSFGLVPAALLGMDISRLLRQSREAARVCQNPSALENPGAYLGVFLGVLARAGRDKAVFLLSPEVKHFGSWIEQLLAESTGKEGRGILPLVRNAGSSPENAGEGRIFIHIGLKGDKTHGISLGFLKKSRLPLFSFSLEDTYELGGQFFIWEMATAIAGHLLGINPFDQPDVAASKKKTEAVLGMYKERKRLPQEKPHQERELARFLKPAAAGDYISVQAFLPPAAEIAAALQNFVARLRAKTGLPATFDFGPRFLHSTGQLHKGDRGNGLFIQLTAEHEKDVDVPDAPGAASSSFSFGVLEDAQARGDRDALRKKGRRIIHFHFQTAPLEGIRRLTNLL